MAGAFLNLNRFLPATRAEGPGLRACLWTQGCLRRCPGCCNTEQLALEPRHVVSSAEVCDWLAEARKDFGIEGATFLGGEPLLQAKGLLPVAKFARQLGLNVMVFTGYTLEECRRDPLSGVTELLAETDVLVDGAYVREKPERVRNWVGSTNQRFHYFTSAYDSRIETDPRYRHVVELREEDGRLLLNGCPQMWTRLSQSRQAVSDSSISDAIGTIASTLQLP